MKTKIKRYKREFLNSGEGMAAIASYVKMEEWDYTKGKQKKKDANVDSTVTISDCNRQVTLEFGAWTKRDVARTRVKWQRLINHVNDAYIEWERAVAAMEDVQETRLQD